ncbi:MFS general substrate transporter [Flagelloscypha sp. PMI_526]|nr:MFS general substrate transporter [Flagelloscypha sp. PMI_526]
MTSSNIPLSPADTLVDDNQNVPKFDKIIDRTNTSLSPKSQLPAAAPQLSNFRRLVLLAVFCLAQFLDVFNVSSLMAAIPSLAVALRMNSSESTWVVSAFQLTFSAFLLVSGKLSDVFNAKYAFVTGITVLSALSLITGFMDNKIALFALRALSGIAGSMTIPSSLTLIVRIFPEPSEQGRAISVFGATGAIGNILGLIIGAIFTQYASWRWVFWFATILALPACRHWRDDDPRTEVKHMDLPGVAALTMAIILFILALTESTTSGWGSAIVIAPLVIAIVLVVSFFFYESWLPQERAAIPSQTWFYKNFSVLFGAALVPVLLVGDRYLSSSLHTGKKSTNGRLSWPLFECSPLVSRVPLCRSHLLSPNTFPVKYILLVGYAGMISWDCSFSPKRIVQRGIGHSSSLPLPLEVLGTMITYVFSNIGIFRSTPPAIAGTVGAMYNGALQLGSAVGSAAVTSIQLSVQQKSGSASFEGKESGVLVRLGYRLWWLP